MSYTPPAVAFQAPITIRWSDQDINGHVNNARALTLVEEARIKASDHWAGGSAERHRFPRVVRSMNVQFHRPMHHGSELSAYVWITRIGNTSYAVRHDLVQEDNLCLSCEAVIVLLDPQTDKPTPVPETLRTALAKALCEDAKGN
ncbi:acyl-CoA thioesterase [Nesterenkonia sp. MY13]|uniref:Acyl-CoA thioesterase n=1 Tax=Nesterenkonia sedimenti TaxID=1463632 RepID=A0A7X8TJZ2_9MICC|nr:thioesterase family protein [Nesterenkonia sedimenti]NLS10161.1 acyl-CoA thioesterase [Nesterenkonia sedimenti]